jgi:hypothetical protein
MSPTFGTVCSELGDNGEVGRWPGVAVTEGLFSLDIGVAAPGIGAVTYGASQALASHEGHLPVIQGLASTKPWGQDAIGRAFEENYQQIVPVTVANWSRISHGLADFAADLVHAQDQARAANQAAARMMSVE